MLAERLVGSVTPPDVPTILIVDDEEGIRRLLTAWISMLGYRVVTAASADEGLEILRTMPVHVAICDILMPHRDGMWLISELQRDFPDTSIVIATGLNEMDPRVTLGAGIAAYIVKPFQFETFGAAMKVALAMQTVSPGM